MPRRSLDDLELVGRGWWNEPVPKGWTSSGVAGMVISLAAKGLAKGEVSAHLGEVYGADDSEDTNIRRVDNAVDLPFEHRIFPTENQTDVDSRSHRWSDSSDRCRTGC